MSEVIDLVMRLHDGVTSVLSGINSQMATTANMADRQGRNLQNIGRGISGIGNALMPVSAAIVGMGAASVKAFVGFDSAVTSAGAKAGATHDEMLKLRDVAKQLGADFPISATQAAEAMDGLAASGMNASQIMSSLPSIVEASVASGENLETTAGIVSGALNTWGLQEGNVAENATRMADVIQMAANKSRLDMIGFGNAIQYAGAPAAALGISVEELSTSLAIMSNNNIEASTSGRALRMMLSRLIDPPKEAADALQKLGIVTTDSQGKFIGLGKVYDQLRTKMQGLTEAEKFKLAGDIAGTESTSALLAVLNTTKEAYDDMRSSMDSATGSSKAQADIMKKTLLGSFKDLESKVEALAISFADVLQPRVQKVADTIGNLAKYFTNLSPAIKNTAIDVGLSIVGFTAFTKILGPITSGIGSLMRTYANVGKVLRGQSINNKLLEVSVKGIARAFSSIGSVAMRVLPIIGRLIPLVFTGPVGIAIGVIALLGLAIYKNFDKVKPVLEGIGQSFIGFVGIIKGAVSRIVTALQPIVSKVADAFGKLISQVATSFGRIYQLMSPFLNIIFTVVSKVAKVLIGGPLAVALGALVVGFNVAIAGITGILTFALTVVEGVVNGITTVLSGITDFLVGVFTGNWSMAWNGIVQIFEGIVMPIQSIFDGVIAGIKASINSLISAVNGISVDIPDWVPGVGGSHFGPLNIPLLYSGTDNWKGGPAMIHDRGAEIVNLPSGAQVIPHAQSLNSAYNQGKRSSSSNSINVNIANLNVCNDGKSVEELTFEIAEQIHYQLQKRSINRMEGAV